MDKQATFNQIATFLLEQGKAAVSSNGICKYRTNATPPLKCAVGCLIPDDKYDPRMEGSSIAGNSLVREALGIKEYSPDEAFLSRLQYVHDSHPASENWLELWKQNMAYVAEEFGLNTEILDAAE